MHTHTHTCAGLGYLQPITQQRVAAEVDCGPFAADRNWTPRPLIWEQTGTVEQEGKKAGAPGKLTCLQVGTICHLLDGGVNAGGSLKAITSSNCKVFSVLYRWLGLHGRPKKNKQKKQVNNKLQQKYQWIRGKVEGWGDRGGGSVSLTFFSISYYN